MPDEVLQVTEQPEIPASLPVAGKRGKIGPQGKGKGANNSAAYNHHYYMAHKALLAARKADRYRTDPEYRDKVKAKRKEQYAREKEDRQKRGRKPRLDSSLRMQVTLSDGKQVTVDMLTIGQFAKRVGVSVHAMRKWTLLRVIPDALYQTPGGHRLYTEHQVYALKDAIVSRAKLGAWKLDQAFTNEVVKAWSALDNGVNRKFVAIALGDEE